MEPDPLDELLKKLNNIPIPDNPLDITEDQMNKISKIIGITMMINMARPSMPVHRYIERNVVIDALERRIEALENVVIQMGAEIDKKNRQ